ncbi:hypothetical protein SynWH8103_01811 [Synechococcus sp. WH 8103]|nr:hypothetical protein SynWH8103_01811 [Synechococcus sp. WH 8103]
MISVVPVIYDFLITGGNANTPSLKSVDRRPTFLQSDFEKSLIGAAVLGSLVLIPMQNQFK